MTGKFPFLTVALCATAIVHGAFVWSNRDLRPETVILSAPPSPLAREALALGDSEFLYRVWSADLQNAGDTGGRATRMRDYDYNLVLGWLTALQDLDPRAHQHDILALRYFSLTPKVPDVHRILDFVAADVALRPDAKWFWLQGAIEIADSRLKDSDYALDLSQRLASYDVPGIPNWLRMFPAVLLEKLKRYDEARVVIAQVQETRGNTFSDDEKLWAEDFIQRLPTP